MLILLWMCRYMICSGSLSLLQLAKIVGKAFPGKYWLPLINAPYFLARILCSLLGLDAGFIM
jgi:hypothetical protein